MELVKNICLSAAIQPINKLYLIIKSINNIYRLFTGTFEIRNTTI